MCKGSNFFFKQRQIPGFQVEKKADPDGLPVVRSKSAVIADVIKDSAVKCAAADCIEETFMPVQKTLLQVHKFCRSASFYVFQFKTEAGDMVGSGCFEMDIRHSESGKCRGFYIHEVKLYRVNKVGDSPDQDCLGYFDMK